MKLSTVLGLNARTQLFSYRYNKVEGKKVARSKLLTKRVLGKANIPTPAVYKKFKTPQEVIDFDWQSLPEAFVLKPSKGMGGEGIIVIRRRSKEGEGWITTQRKRVTEEDLKLHTLDILEGAYSLSNVPDIAFCEEYVGRDKTFRKYAYRGTPDIRVIIFNKVPVMAMLRLPTKESVGRANLHQGAIGVGIDIATGITTRAILHDRLILYKPETSRKLRGIKIPNWTKALELAVKCQEAVGLGYVGVDIVLHPEKGPMVMELNAYPGLRIQLANMIPLRKRLERIDELEVRDAEHGVRIAKALFAERFADRVKAEEGVKTVGVWEEVRLVGSKDKTVVKAKIDTGAWKSSIDKGLASNLGLLSGSNVLWTKLYKSALGQEKRQVVSLTFFLAGRKIRTIANVADRKNLRTPLIIGRRDLEGFLIRPEQV